VTLIVSDIITFILIGVYLVFLKQGRPQNILLFYLSYSVLTDYFINPLIKFTNNEYALGLRMFTIFEFCIVSYYFICVMRTKKNTLFIISWNFLFILISILDYFLDSNSLFDSLPTALSAISLILFSVIFFFLQLKNVHTGFIYAKPEFWEIVGIIIYFSGTLFLFVSSQKNFSNPQFKTLFNIFLTSFSILRNIFWCTAIFVRRNSKSTLS